jgi:L-alanine-DL-glutamate epimerase-like enolase superfamily enzyme
MKVVGLETIRLNEYPSIMFLQVHTDEGIIGLGETVNDRIAMLKTLSNMKTCPPHFES